MYKRVLVRGKKNVRDLEQKKQNQRKPNKNGLTLNFVSQSKL